MTHAIRDGIKIRSLLKEAIIVEGKIASFTNSVTVDEDVIQYDIVFRDQQQRLVHTENRVQLTWQQYQVNQLVQVAYNPSDPQQAMLYSSAELHSWLAFALLGLGMSSFGGLMLIKARLAPGVTYD